MGSRPPEVCLPQEGDVIGGKYTILKCIGEGGMGVVFEATHQKLSQRVAIKMLQPSVAKSADLVARFEREARAAGRLRGRHVARVTDVEVSPGKLPYMVMEFLDGHDLATELEQRGPLPLEDVVDYLLQACKGLAEAHAAGIVHRDLKPSNLFLCNDGDQRVVKLLDFGISKMIDEASKLTSTQLTIGTLLYMSPEQVRSAKHVDARADIWALGVILYELLTGEPPFMGSAPYVAAAIVTDEAPSLTALRRDVPAAIDATFRKALSKLPADRFADVASFAAAIAPFGPPQGSIGRISYKSFPELAPATPPEMRSPLALEIAETMAGGTPLPEIEAAPPPVVSGGTTPGWTSSTGSLARRRAPWIALGGLAIVTFVAGAGLLAVRGTRGARSLSPVPAEPSVTANSATTTAMTTSTDVAPVVTPPPPATATQTAAPTTTATGEASLTAGTARPPPRATARPALSASGVFARATPPATPPAPPPPRKKEEKAPLVAPF